MSLGPVGQRAVLRAFGTTPLDAVARHLHLEPQPAPDPATLGPRDAVVAVESAAVGWVDLIMASGQYQHVVTPPYTPGLEYAGRVAWVGPEAAAHLAVGARVVADGLATGPRSLGPYQRSGGFASWAVAPCDALRPLPAAWTFDQGASFLGSYETAYHALVARGRLAPGETVLVLGASGATGLAAVHLAKGLGATVVAAGRSPAKLAAVAAQGADHVVLSATPDGAPAPFRDAVKALTGGRGVDLIYDPVGGPTSLEALRCAAFGARVLLVGWASTPAVADPGGHGGAPRANTLPTNLLLMKGLDVLGCPAAISAHRDPALRAARLAALDALVAAGRLTPAAPASFPLSALHEALRAKWESRFVGGVVVHP